MVLERNASFSEPNLGDETIYEIYDGTLVAGGGGVTLDINAQLN
jgi:hypothetical protein